jgi:hypothetical protein
VTLVEQHDERALTDCLSVYAPQADDGSRREFAGLLLASRELESRTIPVAQIPIPDCRVTESTVLIRNNEHDFALVGRPRVSESFLDQRRRIAAVLSASLGAIKVLRLVKVGCAVAVLHDLVHTSDHPPLALRSLRSAAVTDAASDFIAAIEELGSKCAFRSPQASPRL